MRRFIGPVVVIVGVIAALVTIATGIVYFCPSCNPLRQGPPDIAGDWDGSLTIKTNHGPTGDIHLHFVEKTDGSLTGQLTVSVPLNSGNNGSVTAGDITADGRIDFTVASAAAAVNLTFSGVYDTRNYRLSGVYYSLHGFSGTWFANKTKAAAIQPVSPPQIEPPYGLETAGAQVFRGGVGLLLIILGLILSQNDHSRTRQATGYAHRFRL